MAGAAAGGRWLARRRLGAMAAVAAPAITFSPVHIGAHHPWHVLAGLVVGEVVALVGWALLSTPLTAVTGWLRRLPALRTVFAAPAGPSARRRKPAPVSGASAT